jgi:hypothetical protein
MKKSKHIQLVLITAALASCHRPAKEWQGGNPVYIRSDSSAQYTRIDHYHPGVGMWYYAFRPYGNYYNGIYHRAGYYSDAFSEEVNIGSNGFKSGIIRGGFGEGAWSVGS